MPTSTGRTVAIAFAAALLAGVLAACAATGATSPPPAAASAEPTQPATASASSSEGATAVPQASSSSSPSASPSGAGPFTLTSPAFAEGAAIPKANTCDGADESPELRWSNAPNGTAAFVLELLDPDAHDWVHWLVLDVPGSSGSIAANVGTGSGAPQQGKNSFGKVGWGGPCPPSGTHRYVFTLFALDAPLGLSGNPDRAAIDKAIATHQVLGKATLTATYRRA